MSDEAAFTDRRGFVDGLDGRTRILAAVALALAIVALRTPAALGLALAGGAGLAATGCVPAGRLMRRMLHLEGFVILLFVGLPLLSPTGPWIHVGPLSVSVDGIVRATLLALRITAAGLVVLTLVSGLTPVRLGHGLDRLGLPDRLTQVLFLTSRYVSLIDGEARRLNEAMRLRGFEAGTNLHTLQTYGHFIGQMLVCSFERAERVMEAMRCRGFHGRFPMISDERFGRGDALFACAAAIAIVAVVGVDLWLRIH